ncbi:MAG: DNA alkylation repair protein [Candidatus Pacearchaeota archaeon]
MADVNEGILEDLRGELEVNSHTRKSNWFGNEGFEIRTPVVRKISSDYFKLVKDLSKKEIFGLCGILIESGKIEERTISFDWAFRLKGVFEKSDFYVFENWVGDFLRDWRDCDDFCTHALGDFLVQYPEFIECVKEWASSDNWVLRRASIVSLIYGIRRGKFLDEVFDLTIKLSGDSHYLVNKGVGWALKESSNLFPHRVFGFVCDNVGRMSRITLRYSIEKYPREKRDFVLESLK